MTTISIMLCWARTFLKTFSLRKSNHHPSLTRLSLASEVWPSKGRSVCSWTRLAGTVVTFRTSTSCTTSITVSPPIPVLNSSLRCAPVNAKLSSARSEKQNKDGYHSFTVLKQFDMAFGEDPDSTHLSRKTLKDEFMRTSRACNIDLAPKILFS